MEKHGRFVILEFGKKHDPREAIAKAMSIKQKNGQELISFVEEARKAYQEALRMSRSL